MKRLFSVVMLAVIALTSCEKDNYHYNNELEPGYGLLSFAGADITVSEEVETRANVNDFFIWVYAVDDNGSETAVKLGNTADYITYGTMPTEGIKLPAGKYKLVAQSATVVPDYGTTPVYGAEREFVIVAGKTTDLSKDENGNPTPIVCTLWQQVKVKVAYNEFFIQHLAGEGIATVKINEKAKMSFKVKGDGSSKTPTYIDEDPGYLKVTEEDTDEDTDASGEVILQVEFEGVMKVKNDDGTYTNKKQKMRAAIPGVKAGQYRKIQFDMAEDKDGNANFTITIDGFVEDVPLTENIDVTEGSLGEDPNKPQGDGGIKLICTAGPDETTMAAWNAAEDKSTMPINVTGFTDLKFTANVPNGVFEFYVMITSDNLAFAGAVNEMLGPERNGKIYLSNDKDRDIIDMFKSPQLGLGFPYSEDVINKTSIAFDLQNALNPLSASAFAGVHTFAMYVTDNHGCTKTINLVLDTTTPKTE